MPLDYDISDRFDSLHIDCLTPEPAYTALAPRPISEQVDASLQRYERRLGRQLTVNEGQVLMHALTAHAPPNTSRFVRCKDCGDWFDQGPLHQRSQVDDTTCGDCDIPF